MTSRRGPASPIAALLLGLLVSGPSVAEPDLQAGIAELDRLFGDLHSGESIQSGLDLARELRRRFPDSPEVAWRMARAGFHAANRARGNARRRTLAWEAYEAGKVALEHGPPGAEAHYWTACALGLYGDAANIFAVIANGVASKVERLLREALRRDRHLNFGGPPEALGRYYYQMPWPVKDLAEALKLLNSAVRIAPERMRSRAYLADAYLADDQPALAEQHYRICIAGDAARPENPDGEDWRRHCEAQLAELKQ